MTLIKTLRAPRVGRFAIFDFAVTFGAAYYLAPKVGVSRKAALLAAVPLGILAHEAFGIDTPLNRMVFGRGK